MEGHHLDAKSLQTILLRPARNCIQLAQVQQSARWLPCVVWMPSGSRPCIASGIQPSTNGAFVVVAASVKAPRSDPLIILRGCKGFVWGLSLSSLHSRHCTISSFTSINYKGLSTTDEARFRCRLSAETSTSTSSPSIISIVRAPHILSWLVSVSSRWL